MDQQEQIVINLIVNAGISIATKESTIMATQTLLTALMQANAGGYMVSTPENIYNLFKKWIEIAMLVKSQFELHFPFKFLFFLYSNSMSFQYKEEALLGFLDCLQVQ